MFDPGRVHSYGKAHVGAPGQSIQRQPQHGCFINDCCLSTTSAEDPGRTMQRTGHSSGQEDVTRWHAQMSRAVRGGTGSQALHECVCPCDARSPA